MRIRLVACLIAVISSAGMAFGENSCPAEAPNIAEMLTCHFGDRDSAAKNCFQVNGRYVLCYHLSGPSELAQVSVVPEDWLGDQEFDLEMSLSRAEVLVLLDQLSPIRSVGRLVSRDRGSVWVVLNNSHREIEEWSNAIVVLYVNEWDGSIRSFNVIYYRQISGRVGRNRPTDCTPHEIPGAPFACVDPEVGPIYLSIDGRGYFLAEKDQRLYKAGQLVDVLAAEPDQSNLDPTEVSVREIK